MGGWTPPYAGQRAQHARLRTHTFDLGHSLKSALPEDSLPVGFRIWVAVQIRLGSETGTCKEKITPSSFLRHIILHLQPHPPPRDESRFISRKRLIPLSWYPSTSLAIHYRASYQRFRSPSTSAALCCQLASIHAFNNENKKKKLSGGMPFTMKTKKTLI